MPLSPARLAAQLLHLAERQVESTSRARDSRAPPAPAGRAVSLSSRVANSGRGATDRLRRRPQSRSVCAAVEEVGDREIGAVLLEDQIGPLDAVDAEFVGAIEAGFALVDHDFAVERGGGRQGRRGRSPRTCGEDALCRGEVLGAAPARSGRMSNCDLQQPRAAPCRGPSDSREARRLRLTRSLKICSNRALSFASPGVCCRAARLAPGANAGRAGAKAAAAAPPVVARNWRRSMIDSPDMICGRD